MIKPAVYRLRIDKGSDFVFSFKLYDAGGVLDLSSGEVLFKASYGGVSAFDLSSGDSPSLISIDSDNKVTITIAASQTDIDFFTLNFSIDTLINGSNKRWMIGAIDVVNAA